MIELEKNRYGKSRVRLMKVTREPEENRLVEWTVEVLLTGDFASAYLEGDNSRVLPTDTMKNTVYYVARRSKAASMEEYANELSGFLLERNAQVDSVRVGIEGATWKRITVDGRPHPTAFLRGSSEVETAQVLRERGGLRVRSGLDNLVVMKTADSSFAGYLKDELTTLQETSDRLFCTAVKAEWEYRAVSKNAGEIDFELTRRAVREAMLKTFAGHRSRSVQETLYAMGRSALEAAWELEWIDLTMPNKHCLPVDLERFGIDNPNEIFVPTDEPAGHIQARVRRSR